MKKNRNFRIAVFLLISLIWSLAWFSQKHALEGLFDQLPSGVIILFGLVPAFGLVIAGAMGRNMLADGQMSFMGKDSKSALAIVAVPILGLCIFGVENPYGLQPNLFGLLIGAFTLLYALMEEFGWRGYLQQEFSLSTQKWIGYVFIGFFWYSWHWYFLRQGNDPRWIMIPILIAASAGIGEVARSTKSILICGTMHGLVNMIVIYGVVANNISGLEKGLLLGTCILIWVPLIMRIEKMSE